MRGDSSVYIIYRYRDLGFLDLFTYMSSCSTFRFRRTRTGSYRETASPMLNFPASHSVWQFLETARPTLNLPVRTDGPTTFSTSAAPDYSRPDKELAYGEQNVRPSAELKRAIIQALRARTKSSPTPSKTFELKPAYGGQIIRLLVFEQTKKSEKRGSRP